MGKITLQYKWDVYLLSAWYNHAGMLMEHLRDRFLKQNSITLDDCIALKRFQFEDWRCRYRTQPWICANLPTLSTILWEKDITNVFDIAGILKSSSLDVAKKPRLMIEKEERNEADKLKRIKKRIHRADKEWHDNFESYKASNQWNITK